MSGNYHNSLYLLSLSWMSWIPVFFPHISVQNLHSWMSGFLNFSTDFLPLPSPQFCWCICLSFIPYCYSLYILLYLYIVALPPIIFNCTMYLYFINKKDPSCLLSPLFIKFHLFWYYFMYFIYINLIFFYLNFAVL